MTALSAQDVEDIHELLARYCWAFDAGDGEAYAATFAEDGQMGGRGTHYAGREQLAGFATNSYPSTLASQHWNTNVVLEPSGESVSSTCYMMGPLRGADGTLGVGILGKYDDTLVHTAEGWRFARRTFTRWE